MAPPQQSGPGSALYDHGTVTLHLPHTCPHIHNPAGVELTIETTTGGGDLTQYVPDPDDLVAGTEDLDESDIRFPRLKIMPKTAVFQDSQTGVELEAITTIILGLVKQRIFW